MSDRGWYVESKGSVVGPSNLTQLRRMVHMSLLPPETNVWRKEDPTLQRLDDLLALNKPARSPAAATPPDGLVLDDGWTIGCRFARRRFVGRLIDLQFHGLIGGFLLWYALFSFVPLTADDMMAPIDRSGGTVLAAVANAVVAVPVGAIVIGLSGFSLGKWLCGIRICDASLKPPGIPAAMARELRVLVRGLGFALTPLFLICGILALRRLNRHGMMSWDETNIQVLARPAGSRQTLLFVAACLVVLLWFGLRTLGWIT